MGATGVNTLDNTLDNTWHRQLVNHELGHALVGLLCGRRVRCIWAPPPEPFAGYVPEDPDEPAGFVDYAPGSDRRAKALSLLGGVLAGGEPAPAWPIKPRSRDERQLAELLRDTDELTYLETIRDAERLITSDEYDRMYMFASELLAHPPHRINQRQCEDIMRLKEHHHEQEDDEDIRELEDRLIAEGLIPARASRYQEADDIFTGLGENGDHPSEAKAHHSRIRTEARDQMLALFEGADLERKSMSRVTVAVFDC